MEESAGESKGQSARPSRHREMRGFWKWVVLFLTLFGILISITQIFLLLTYFGFSLYEINYFYMLFLCFLPLVFLIFPAGPSARRDRVPWYDAALFGLTFVCLLYFSIHGFSVFFEGWMFEAPPTPTVLGAVLLVLVLETLRRTTGMVFFLFCAFFVFFPVIAPHIPAPFTGIGFSLVQTVRIHSMGTESLLGIPIKVMGNLLLGFMIFGVAMTATGGGKFFLNFSLAMMGNLRGGPAKVAVIASALFGSLSGSIISNVLTTGSMTIPAMKRLGYPSHYAGAIETCSSTGGVLMPPIMGATAFIMAMFLGVPYMTIAVAALVPSLLYFAGLLMQVDAFAAKMGISGIARVELPSLRRTIKEGWFYIFAFFLLIWFVAYLRLEAQAPFLASAALLILTMIRRETRLDRKGLLRLAEETGKLLAELQSVLAGVSLMIGALTVTGVASAFASEVIRVAGGNLYFLLLVTAFTSLLLGTGMTITACYIFLALMVAPVLEGYGLNTLAIHLFLMYYGMLSYITPPVAIGAFAAATVAGSPPMRTGFTAMRLGLITYFIPFFFVLNPAMILQGGDIAAILWSFGTCLFGIALISGALVGYMWGMGRIGLPYRVAGFVSGFLIALPHTATDLYGFLIFLGAFVIPRISGVRKRTGPRRRQV